MALVILFVVFLVLWALESILHACGVKPKPAPRYRAGAAIRGGRWQRANVRRYVNGGRR